MTSSDRSSPVGLDHRAGDAGHPDPAAGAGQGRASFAFRCGTTGDHVGQPGIGNLWGGLAWIAGLVGLTALIGFYGAMLLFFPVFLIVRARAGLLATVLMTAGAAGIILLLAWALSLNFPSGMLQDAMDLPWPFR
ncbi:hypothetical protein V6L77_14665 [Pannonibacter sp. Pt2-lr]